MSLFKTGDIKFESNTYLTDLQHGAVIPLGKHSFIVERGEDFIRIAEAVSELPWVVEVDYEICWTYPTIEIFLNGNGYHFISYDADRDTALYGKHIAWITLKTWHVLGYIWNVIRSQGL